MAKDNNSSGKLDKTNFDVIIAGAGPGGSSCAGILTDKGYNVLLLEKATFPRDKTCGDAVSGKSMTVVKRLGLQDEIEKNPHAKIYGVTFSSPKGTIVNIPFEPDSKKKDKKYRSYGYVCRRMVFDNLVFQNAKKKVSKCIEGFVVKDLIFEGDYVKGIKGLNHKTGKEEEYRAKIVVGADGANSVVARKAGLNEVDPKHWLVAIRAYYKDVKDVTDDIELHFIDSLMPGYFWIFPADDGMVNVGAGIVMEDLQKNKVNLTKEMMKIIEEHPIFKERFRGAKKIGDIKGWNLPVGSKKRKAYGNGFVLIGDAASLIDPFSGEGIGNSMTSGSFAADRIEEAIKANDFSEEFMKIYQDRLWEEIGPELKTSYDLQRWGKHQWLLNFVIDKAARSREVQEWISGMLANEEAKKELVHPLFYLKLLLA